MENQPLRRQWQKQLPAPAEPDPVAAPHEETPTEPWREQFEAPPISTHQVKSVRKRKRCRRLMRFLSQKMRLGFTGAGGGSRKTGMGADGTRSAHEKTDG